MIRQNLKIPKACQFYFNTGMRRLRVLYYLKMANKNVSNYQKWSKSLVSPYKSVHEFNLLKKGINRKSDKFSLISDNYGQCNWILSFPLAQNKVLGGGGGWLYWKIGKCYTRLLRVVTILESRKYHTTFFKGKKEKSEVCNSMTKIVDETLILIGGPPWFQQFHFFKRISTHLPFH